MPPDLRLGPDPCLGDRPGDRRAHRPRAPGSGRRGSGASGLAAAERQEPADGEADYGGADRELALVLADLTAPVRELADAAAEGLDLLAELLALAHDVVANLLGAASAGRRARALGALDVRRGARDQFVSHYWSDPAWSVSLISLPSSMAMAGTGGAPAFMDL